MTQANQKGVIWTTIICSVVLLTALIWGLTSISVPEVVVPTEGAIISGVLAGIVVPAVPIMDTITTDRICELTDGCEYWEPESGDLSGIFTALQDEEATEDFVDAFSDLISLDDDEYKFVLSAGVKKLAEKVVASELGQFYRDHQIRIEATEYPEDEEDENWETKTFMRVKYFDIDEGSDEKETAYIVVTSVLDEGEYDELSIQKVSRTFEF